VTDITCNVCGSANKVECEEKDLASWRNGEGPIQQILSYISAADRELLISGTCGKCFDSMFGSEDEEDEE